jgi:integrase/recombinase XerC
VTGANVDAVWLLAGFEEESLTGLSPATAHKHARTVLRFSAWLDRRDLLEVSSGLIVEWLDELHLAAGPRADRVGSLHRFYNWALNRGLVARDPAAPLMRIRRPVTAGELPELSYRWMVAQQRKALSAKTVEKRLCLLRLFSDHVAPRSILDATRTDVEEWLDMRRAGGRPLGPKARYAYISSLHMFYSWARREGLVEADVTEEVDRPRLPVGVPRPILTADLARALHRAGPAVRAILCLAAFAGLRAQEIAGVRREDLLEHLDEPMLVVSAPKGGRQRTVPLHPAAWEALVSYGMPRSGHIFARPDGKAWPAWKVSDTANSHLGSLGIPSSLHKLRHWYATEVYAASLDLRLTQELLGHASPTTTAIYTQWSKRRATEIVATLKT